MSIVSENDNNTRITWRTWGLLYIISYLVLIVADHFLGTKFITVDKIPTTIPQWHWFIFEVVVVNAAGFWFVFIVYYLDPKRVYQRIYNVHTQ